MEFLNAVNKFDDEQSLLTLLHERASSLGFNAAAYFRPTIGNFGRIEIRERGFPKGWSEHYTIGHHEQVDPNLEYVARSGRTLQFSRIAELRQLFAHQTAFLEESDKWGLTDGFLVPAFGSFPLPGSGLFPFLGWFAFRQVKSPDILKDTNIAYLEAIAQATHIQFSRISKGNDSDRPKLAPREIAILNWISVGKTNTEIATILNIGVPTVATYVRRIFEKLDVHDRAAAAVKGIKHGYVQT